MDYGRLEDAFNNRYRAKVAEKVQCLSQIISLLEGENSEQSLREVDKRKEKFNSELDASFSSERQGANVLAGETQELAEETIFAQLMKATSEQKAILRRLAEHRAS